MQRLDYDALKMPQKYVKTLRIPLAMSFSA